MPKIAVSLHYVEIGDFYALKLATREQAHVDNRGADCEGTHGLMRLTVFLPTLEDVAALRDALDQAYRQHQPEFVD